MGQADHIWKEPLHRTRGHLQPKKTSKEQLPAIVCFHFHPSPVEGKLAFRSHSDAFFSTGELIPWLSRRHWNVIFLCFHCLNNRPLNVKRQQPPRVPQLVEPLAYYIANIHDIWKPVQSVMKNRACSQRCKKGTYVVVGVLGFAEDSFSFVVVLFRAWAWHLSREPTRCV